MKHKNRTPEEYHEGMKQNWTKSAHDGVRCFYDQFGFRIDCTEKHHTLYRHGEQQIVTLSMEAAKQISIILLNDKILHTKIE